MREIKFRGKDVESGAWVYGGFYISSGVGNCIIAHGDGWRPTYNDPDTGEGTVFTSVDPKTVGQYTGIIHEKREVFEGDVFQHPDGTKFFVKWDQGHCSFRANYYDDNLTSLLISQLDKDRGKAKHIYEYESQP